jgi:hypothetical protein
MMTRAAKAKGIKLSDLSPAEPAVNVNEFCR